LAVSAARQVPLAAAAFGGYVAFLLHAAVDWDWEMPAVTLTGLFCGVSVLLAARGEEAPRPGRVPRAVGVAVAALVGLVALVGYAGNRAEASASDALDASRLPTAVADARQARRWEPWSPVPWRLLGEAQLQAGQVDEARASFRRGIAKDSRSWELWFDLALTERGRARRLALARVAALNPLSTELKQLAGSG
jgi:Flp pilus assembly protein TadD